MSGLKQHEVLSLPLQDVLDMFKRCEDFAWLLAVTRSSGGKYGRVERLVEQARQLEAEMERLRQKAQGRPGCLLEARIDELEEALGEIRTLYRAGEAQTLASHQYVRKLVDAVLAAAKGQP